MNTVSGPTSLTGANASPDSRETARLRGVAQQLEGVFVRQLYAAMRSTTASEGVLDGGAGEEMFTSMLDEQVANETPQQWHHGIAEQVVSQLRSRLPATLPGAAK